MDVIMFNSEHSHPCGWIPAGVYPVMFLNGGDDIDLFLLVPGAGIEPARDLVPRDFKSLASTYSATRAKTTKKKG